VTLDADWCCSTFPILGRCPAHTCDAAEAAAVGALPRNVVAILLEDEELFRSLPSFRNVLNIPPLFSGLGVLDPLRGCSPGGTKFEAALPCRLLFLGVSSPDFFLPR
jgi:hypothetical protein